MEVRTVVEQQSTLYQVANRKRSKISPRRGRRVLQAVVKGNFFVASACSIGSMVKEGLERDILSWMEGQEIENVFHLREASVPAGTCADVRLLIVELHIANSSEGVISVLFRKEISSDRAGDSDRSDQEPAEARNWKAPLTESSWMRR